MGVMVSISIGLQSSKGSERLFTYCINRVTDLDQLGQN